MAGASASGPKGAILGPSRDVAEGPKSDIQFADRVAGYATFVIVWLDSQSPDCDFQPWV